MPWHEDVERERRVLDRLDRRDLAADGARDQLGAGRAPARGSRRAGWSATASVTVAGSICAGEMLPCVSSDDADRDPRPDGRADAPDHLGVGVGIPLG